MTMIFMISACAKKPTTEQCKNENEKVEEWILNNFDKDAEIEKKYPDLAKLLRDSNYDKAKEPMTKAIKERYNAARANAACAELTVNDEIYKLKCEKEGQKVSEWAQNNSDKAMEIEEKYEEKYVDLDNLVRSGDVEKIKEVQTNMSKEYYIAAGADTACVETNGDLIVALIKCSDEIEKIEKWENENPEKMEKIVAKYPESEREKLMKKERFDLVRYITLKLMREIMTAASADVSCAEPMADYLTYMVKERSTALAAMQSDAETLKTADRKTENEIQEKNEPSMIEQMIREKLHKTKDN